MESTVSAFGVTHVGGSPHKENQDTFFTSARTVGGAEETFLGIFDGHGAYGLPVATAVRDVFQSATAEQLADLSALYKTGDDAAREAIFTMARARGRADVTMEADGTLVARSPLAARQVLLGGTTASLVRVKGLDLEISHVGDSEVLVIDEPSREFTVLTKDHSSTSVSEWERVLAETPIPPRVEFDTAGGAYGRGQLPRPVFTLGDGGKWQLNPAGGYYVSNVRRDWAAYVHNGECSLNMLRAIGDFALRKNGVNFLPDVIQHRLKTVGRSFVLAASDGLFDPLQYEEIRDAVLEAAAAPGATAQTIAAAVLSAGLASGKKLFGSAQDNTTVAIAIVEPRCPADICHGEPESL
jgi:serine/threonine protein phosphatase PrpC